MGILLVEWCNHLSITVHTTICILDFFQLFYSMIFYIKIKVMFWTFLFLEYYWISPDIRMKELHCISQQFWRWYHQRLSSKHPDRYLSVIVYMCHFLLLIGLSRTTKEMTKMSLCTMWTLTLECVRSLTWLHGCHGS